MTPKHSRDFNPDPLQRPQVRFFELLDMFKVVELEKGKPATFKQGGDERPVVVRQKEFALAIPKVKAWGVEILEGTPTDMFAEVSDGAGKMGFDACVIGIPTHTPQAGLTG